MSGFSYHYLLCQHFSCFSSYGLSVAVYIVAGWKYLINILTLLSLVDLLIEMSPNSVVDTKFFSNFQFVFLSVSAREGETFSHLFAFLCCNHDRSVVLFANEFCGAEIWWTFNLGPYRQFLFSLQGGESMKIGVIRGLGVKLGYWVGWVGLGLGWVVSMGWFGLVVFVRFRACSALWDFFWGMQGLN